MIHQALHSISRLGSVLSTSWGWATFAALAVMDYISGHSFVVFLVLAATIIDAVWGIAVSLKQGEFTKSELARLTIAKFAVYGCAMFIFIGLDKFVDTTITASIVGALIVLVEFWSSCGSMLILFPNFLFLRIMKKALVGEVASKLKISEEEAMELLEGNRKIRKTDKTN